MVTRRVVLILTIMAVSSVLSNAFEISRQKREAASGCTVINFSGSHTITEPYAQSISKCWIFKGGADKLLRVTPVKLSMDTTPFCDADHVTVKDEVTGEFYGRFCGPVCTSSNVVIDGNQARVSYVTDDVTGQSGYHGIDVVVEELPNYARAGSNCECHQEGTGCVACREWLVKGSDYITSYDYKNTQSFSYPNNIDCRWEIPEEEGLGLAISFETFALEKSPNCANDYVTISTESSSGEVVEYIRACGSACMPLVVIPAGYHMAVVTFTSDDQVALSGFQFYYNKKEEGITPDTALNECRCQTNAEAQCIISGLTSHSLQTCGAVIKGDVEGYLVSPGWPEGYPNDMDCTWEITAPDDAHVLLLTMGFMELASPSDCADDYVELFDQNRKLIVRVCDAKCRPRVTTDQRTVVVHFKSDAANTATGFLLQYTVMPQGRRPPGGLVTPYVVMNFDNVGSGLHVPQVECLCNGGTDTCIVPSQCDHTFFHEVEVSKDVDFQIYSPGYPNLYPVNSDCVWEISAPWATKITMAFVNIIDLEFSIGCPNDFVEVSNKITGTTLLRLCGSECAPNVVVNSAKAEVRFRSNSNIEKNGFDLSYRMMTIEPDKYDIADCGTTCAMLDDPAAHGCIVPYNCDIIDGQTSGSISSPRFPLRYPPNVDCEWYIRADPGQVIDISFKALDLELSDTCDHDYVSITNTETNQLLLQVCNAACSPHLEFHSTGLSVHFHSNAVTEHYGFHLDFVVRSSTNSYDVVKCNCLNDLTSGCSNSEALALSGSVCGQTAFTEPTGTLLWPTGDLPTHKSCVYTILGSGQQVIKTTFDEFDVIPNSDDCADIDITLEDGDPSVTLHSLRCVSINPGFWWRSTQNTVILTLFNYAPLAQGEVGMKIRYELEGEPAPGGASSAPYQEPTKDLFVPPSGLIYKPPYPGNNPNVATQIWTITAPAGQQIELEFLQFNMDAGDCANNNLLVQDGPMPDDCVGDKVCTTLCGPNGLTIWTTRPNHNAFVLRLTRMQASDPQIYFEILYGIKGQLLQLGQVESQCGDPGIRGDCGGTVLSPNFPGHYPYDLSCAWQFQSVAGQGLSVTIMQLSIEFTVDCSKDLFTLQSSLVNQHCQDSSSGSCLRVCKTLVDVPWTSWFAGGTATMILSTDGDGSAKGFHVTYSCYDLSAGQNALQPDSTGTQAQEVLYNSVGPYNQVYLLSADASGVLVLPPYPPANPEFFSVTWVIEAQIPADQSTVRIELNMAEFDMETSGGQTGANFTILNSKPPDDQAPPNHCVDNGACNVLYNKFSNYKWLSNGPVVVLQAIWNKAYANDVSFEIAYGVEGNTPSSQSLNSMESTCGAYEQRGCSGVIQSPNYPNNYPNDLNCFWLILADSGRGLKVKLISLGVEYSPEPCTKDVFTSQPGFYTSPCLQNGINDCFRKCKTLVDVPVSLFYSSGRATLHLFSDASGVSTGFRAEYSCYDVIGSATGAQDVITGCGATSLTAPSGVVETPTSVPTEAVECIWSIEAPEGWTIVVTFETIKMGTSHGCYDAELSFQNWPAPYACPQNNYCSYVCDDSLNNPPWTSHTNAVVIRYYRRQGVQEETRVRFSYQMINASPQQTLAAPDTNQCGLRPVSMLTGGTGVLPHSWPWMGYLRGYDGSNTLACGATLIDQNWAITAAHCVHGSGPFILDLGSHSLSTIEGVEMQHPVQSVFIHPDYNDKQNDLALLRLQTPVSYSSAISPACVGESYNPDMYKRCVVTGWGQQADGSIPDTLQEVEMTIQSVDHVTCLMEPTWICAGAQMGQGVCVGDSGGPLVCEENGRYFLAGVVSWGYLPCGQWDGVFMRLSMYTSWIQQTTNGEVVFNTV